MQTIDVAASQVESTTKVETKITTHDEEKGILPTGFIFNGQLPELTQDQWEGLEVHTIEELTALDLKSNSDVEPLKGYITLRTAKYLHLASQAWLEVGKTIAWVKQDDRLGRIYGYTTLKEWIENVLHPSLPDGLRKASKTLQNWGTYAQTQSALAEHLTPRELPYMDGLGLKVEDYKKLQQLLNSPGSLFPGVDIPADVVADVRPELEKYIAKQMTLWDASDIDDSTGEGVMAKAKEKRDAIKEILLSANAESNSLYAARLIGDNTIEVGKYYKCLQNISWYHPAEVDDEGNQKWEKRTVRGLKDEWCLVKSYDPSDKTVKIVPWNHRLLSAQEHAENRMSTDGELMDPIPVLFLDTKEGHPQALEEDDVVQSERASVPVVLSIGREHIKRLSKGARRETIDLDEYISGIVEEYVERMKSSPDES